MFGGLEDFIEDSFGFKLPVCDVAEGFVKDQMFKIMIKHYSIDSKLGYIPKFTEKGFVQMRIPEDLYKDILEEREKALGDGKISAEYYDRALMIDHNLVFENEDEEICMIKQINRTELINMRKSMIEKIFKTLGPVAEEWAGIKLKTNWIYGIRRYRNNSWLFSHIDHFGTQVISVIMNIGQEVKEDWPLYMKDNHGVSHKLILSPGDMVWYESARLEHSRQKPLNGQYYDNMYIHYSPRGLWYTNSDSLNRRAPFGVKPISLKAVKKSQEEMGETDWEEAWRLYKHPDSV